jgi:uncharacterized protein (TIGR02145 family)
MTKSSISLKLGSNFFFIVFSLLLVSCQEEPLPTGDIEGVVLYAGTVIPVEGVSVKAGEIAAMTPEDGSYHLSEVTAGTQTVNAEKVGFIPFSTAIDVQEGLNQLVIPMITPVFSSTVQGCITGDFSGNPQAGLTVVMLNPDNSESEITGTTNGEGFYQLQHVPFGDRTIIVKSSGSRIYQVNISISVTDFNFDIEISEPMIFSDARDGHSYSARKIGSQIWMETNLAYLPQVGPPDWESDKLELYYVYGYIGTDISEAKATPNYSTYGALYNWPAATTACPTGWHLPSDTEWKILEIYLGMETEDADEVKWRLTGEVGTKLKSDSGWESDGNGSNESGFGALPGGSRGTNDDFGGIGIYCNFWTSSLNPSSMPWNRFLSYEKTGVSRYGFSKILGFSVRCVKDDE